MSKYDTTSTFPHQIDPPVFFSDIRLEHEVALGAYKELIAEKKYDEAIAYLEAHTEVDAYCSDLFNMLVNRVKNLQVYCKNGYGANNNIVLNITNGYYESENLTQNTICLSSEVDAKRLAFVYDGLSDRVIEIREEFEKQSYDTIDIFNNRYAITYVEVEEYNADDRSLSSYCKAVTFNEGNDIEFTEGIIKYIDGDFSLVAKTDNNNKIIGEDNLHDRIYWLRIARKGSYTRIRFTKQTTRGYVVVKTYEYPTHWYSRLYYDTDLPEIVSGQLITKDTQTVSGSSYYSPVMANSKMVFALYLRNLSSGIQSKEEFTDPDLIIEHMVPSTWNPGDRINLFNDNPGKGLDTYFNDIYYETDSNGYIITENYNPKEAKTIFSCAYTELYF